MYKLRPYQEDAVTATIRHFQQQRSPALIVLPTGAGKSLVIAELARKAKGRVLVLAHVRELVEQNHAKYVSYELTAGIYSAGLNRKQSEEKVIFGSIQSVARAQASFFQDFSLLVIDECHRVSTDSDTQYLQVIKQLVDANPQLCILGLTATPFRLGLGWIYQFHHRGTLRSAEERFFKKCIFELSLAFMIKNNYLTPPITIDAPVVQYDFTSLLERFSGGSFRSIDIENVLKDQKRITPSIVDNIIDLSSDRQGVMIFTASVRHAEEILSLLPAHSSALVIGDTDDQQRDQTIEKFKRREIKYLVNVSVLTTGFDAPHVDVIAVLRPTESVSLYQQIVGRGLRLSEGKKDCLVLDYTGSGHNIFRPEITENKPLVDSVPVIVPCPLCRHENNFWGIIDDSGYLVEHFGRKCQGAVEDPLTFAITNCQYRFRFCLCDRCAGENDIAARICCHCQNVLVDNDKKLKDAMSLKGAHVMRPDSMHFQESLDKRGGNRLEIRYYDLDAKHLTEYFYLNNSIDARSFYYNFIRMHNRVPERDLSITTIRGAIENQAQFRLPTFIIARKQKYYWVIREKIF